MKTLVGAAEPPERPKRFPQWMMTGGGSRMHSVNVTSTSINPSVSANSAPANASTAWTYRIFS